MRWKHKTFDQYEWHQWFAWYPVVVECEWVWLERVERRASRRAYPGEIDYEYKHVDNL